MDQLTDNPYKSPRAADSNLSPTTRKRPIGLAILAIVHAMIGLLFSGLGTYLAFDFQETRAEFDGAIAPSIIMVVSIVTFGACILASGVGALFGIRWGWWLSAFFQFGWMLNFAFRFLAALRVLITNVDRSIDIITALAGLTISLLFVAIPTLALVYLYRGSVLAYFELERMSKVKSILLLTAVSFVMIVAIAIALFIGTRFFS